MTDAPGDRVSLGETAYRRLRADIISCRLAPGQRLTERGLAMETGLGVSPIRDALTRLDHDGLVKTVPRKGYQVTPLTVKTVDDLWFSQQTGIALERMNAYGCSLIYGHPQGPTGARLIVELLHTLRLRGGGIGLFTGCAAGDTGAAVVVRVED